jgi:FkbM family methyltransferase
MTVHENDFDLSKKTKIVFEGMDYWVMPRYIHHYIHNQYERFSLKILGSLLDENSTFVDIGAHYGAYTLYAANKCNSKVIALEPVDENRSLLTENVVINKLDSKVTVHDYAASDEDGEAVFNIPWASDSAGFYDHPLADTFKKQKVIVKNMDGLIGNQKVDLMKIDTEGNEIKVLRGLRDTLRHNPQLKLIVEANPACLDAAGESIEKLLEVLINDCDKEVYVVDENQFRLSRITNCPERWSEYIDGYANLLCVPKQNHHFGVFLLHSNELGGGELALLEHVEYLRKKNIFAHVIVPYAGELQEMLIAKGISHSVVTYSFWDAGSTSQELVQKNYVNIEASTQIARIAAAVNADFMANNSLVCPWGYLAAKSLALPLVWFVHEFGDADHGIKFVHDLNLVRNFIVEQSDVVLCCSEAVAKPFASSKEAMSKVQVIYNAIDIEHIQNLSQQPTKDYFEGADLKLCIVGRVNENKGQLQAIQALAILSPRFKNARLILAGSIEGGYKKTIEAEINRLGLEKNVEITGRLANPYPTMAQADIVLVPSRNEAFGRVTAEGMILGKPVVAAASGGTIELIQDNKTGWLFKPGDKEDLAAKIKDLHSRKDKGASIGTAATVAITKLLGSYRDGAFKAISALDFSKEPKASGMLMTSEVVDAVASAAEDKEFLRKLVAEHKVVRSELEAELKRQQERANNTENHLKDILGSKSWIVTRPIRVGTSLGKRGARKLQRKALEAKEQRFKRQLAKDYAAESLKLNRIKREKDTHLAVIIHLYYPELWGIIKKRIKQIAEDGVGFDIFITLPPDKQEFAQTIRKTFKKAYIFTLPNQGRDVLPFLVLASALEQRGYLQFLKLHTKKSLHREDGEEWFREILSDLIPEDKRTRKKIIQKLSEQETGLIGPAEQYISLLVNHQANANNLQQILKDVTSPELTSQALKNQTAYGFIAGTMFWGRFDAIKGILKQNYSNLKFDLEKGQIDGTFAHAMERALAVVPEIELKNLYGVSQKGLELLEYHTDNIPEWSDVYPAESREP